MPGTRARVPDFQIPSYPLITDLVTKRVSGSRVQAEAGTPRRRLLAVRPPFIFSMFTVICEGTPGDCRVRSPASPPSPW